MAPAFIEFNRRLRWADADAAGRLHFPRIFEIYQLFDTGEELAIEGTMTVVVLQNGKPTEIPQALRAALGGETSDPGCVAQS